MHWQFSTSSAFKRSSEQWNCGTENWVSTLSIFYHHQLDDSVPINFRCKRNTFHSWPKTKERPISCWILSTQGHKFRISHTSLFMLKNTLCNVIERTLLDSRFCKIFPRHNKKSEKTSTFVRWKLITLSSSIKDKYFHAMILPTNCFLSWEISFVQTRWYVEHLFKCEICCVHNGLTIVQVILSHEYRWFHCCIHNHSQIIKRFPMSCIASSGERSNILRNGSFTLFKNDHDLRETFAADKDVVSVWDHVGLLLVETFGSRFEHCVVLERIETKFLFNTTTDLPLFNGRQRVSSLRRDPHQIHCKDTTSQIPIEGWREAERKFSWVGTVCNTSSPESIKMPVVPTGRRKNKLAMYIACSLKSQIRSASSALGESSGPEKLQWAKRDCHQFVVECVSNGVHTALRKRSNRLHHWRLQQRRNHRWKLKHRHPFSFHLDAFHLNRQKSELLKARVKHARKCIKTVAAGRRGARDERHLWSL